jgi:hypothetical protein
MGRPGPEVDCCVTGNKIKQYIKVHYAEIVSIYKMGRKFPEFRH